MNLNRGDIVEYIHNGNERKGLVKDLNQYKVTLLSKNNQDKTINMINIPRNHITQKIGSQNNNLKKGGFMPTIPAMPVNGYPYPIPHMTPPQPMYGQPLMIPTTQNYTQPNRFLMHPNDINFNSTTDPSKGVNNLFIPGNAGNLEANAGAPPGPGRYPSKGYNINKGRISEQDLKEPRKLSDVLESDQKLNPDQNNFENQQAQEKYEQQRDENKRDLKYFIDEKMKALKEKSNSEYPQDKSPEFKKDDIANNINNENNPGLDNELDEAFNNPFPETNEKNNIFSLEDQVPQKELRSPKIDTSISKSLSNHHPEEVLKMVKELSHKYITLRDIFRLQHEKFMEICTKIGECKNNLLDKVIVGTAGNSGNIIFAGQPGEIKPGTKVNFKLPDSNNDENVIGITQKYDETNKEWEIKYEDKVYKVKGKDINLDIDDLNKDQKVAYLEKTLFKLHDELKSVNDMIGGHNKEIQHLFNKENECYENWKNGGFHLNNISYDQFKKHQNNINISDLDQELNQEDQSSKYTDNNIFNLDNYTRNYMDQNTPLGHQFLNTNLEYKCYSDDKVGVKIEPIYNNIQKYEIPVGFNSSEVFSVLKQEGGDIEITYKGNEDKFKKIFDEKYHFVLKDDPHNDEKALKTFKIINNQWDEFNNNILLSIKDEEKLINSKYVRPFLLSLNEGKESISTTRMKYLSNLYQQMDVILKDIKGALYYLVEKYARIKKDSIDNITNSFIPPPKEIERSNYSLEESSLPNQKSETIQSSEFNKPKKKGFLNFFSNWIGGGEENETRNSSLEPVYSPNQNITLSQERRSYILNSKKQINNAKNEKKNIKKTLKLSSPSHK